MFLDVLREVEPLLCNNKSSGHSKNNRLEICRNKSEAMLIYFYDFIFRPFAGESWRLVIMVSAVVAGRFCFCLQNKLSFRENQRNKDS